MCDMAEIVNCTEAINANALSKWHVGVSFIYDTFIIKITETY